MVHMNLPMQLTSFIGRERELRKFNAWFPWRSRHPHRAGRGRQNALLLQAFTLISLGRFDPARSLLDECLLVAHEVGNLHRVAYVYKVLGDLERCKQNFGGAQAAYEQCLSYLRELGSTHSCARAWQRNRPRATWRASRKA